MSPPTSFDPAAVRSFTYQGWELDADQASLTLRCHYALDAEPFTEVIGVDLTAGDHDAVDTAAVDQAARLVFLLAGVSYYKAAAPPLIELEGDGLTTGEHELLMAHYLDGLGEYAYRNGLDLGGLRIEAATQASPPPRTPPDRPRRPLIPFGGGIDSIVTVEGVRAAAPDADPALFILSRPGDHFAAIDAPAAVTGLSVTRAWRTLDPKVLESGARGYRNGHVPVTGILSAIALLAAAAHERDAVVMSNEWSASSPNLDHLGRPVNHQWSKSLAFEDLLRRVIATSPLAGVNYHSWLRPRSELWVARQFAALERYHPAFRSCNRSFTLDPARRLDQWCGTCDKCCFIDLILAPYVDATDLAKVFHGNEPLRNEALGPVLDALCGLSDDAKPFECVGDVDECRVAAALAARRHDRSDDAVLTTLARRVAAIMPGDPTDHAAVLLAPLGPHHIPSGLAPPDLADLSAPVDPSAHRAPSRTSTQPRTTHGSDPDLVG